MWYTAEQVGSTLPRKMNPKKRRRLVYHDTVVTNNVSRVDMFNKNSEITASSVISFHV